MSTMCNILDLPLDIILEIFNILLRQDEQSSATKFAIICNYEKIFPQCAVEFIRFKCDVTKAFKNDSLIAVEYGIIHTQVLNKVEILKTAVRNNKYEMINLLLKYYTGLSQNALEFAVLRYNANVIRYLIRNKLSIVSLNSIQTAIFINDFEMVKFLFKHCNPKKDFCLKKLRPYLPPRCNYDHVKYLHDQFEQ